jgi:class 3 adenylate cyclase
MEVPEVRFAQSRGVRIAYQEFGSGPPVVVIPPLVSNMELLWEHELYRRVLEYQARHLHVAMFDKRGIGLSDRFEEHPTLEQRIEDVTAVMDAVGFERASIVGLSEGGLMAQLFASTCPERVDRLVVINTGVLDNQVDAEEILRHSPIGSAERARSVFDQLVESWGEDPRFFVEWFSPSQIGNVGFVRWTGRYECLSATRADLRRQIDSIFGLMVAYGPEALARIEAPTLVMSVRGDRIMPPGFSPLIAERVRDARLVEFDGEDHFCWMMPDWREVNDSLIGFLIDQPIVQREQERRFAVVLFTDIVNSTATAASMGDTTWRETLDSHDRIAWRSTDRHRGHIVKTTGDGLLAIFDTPSAAISCATELRSDLAGIGLDIRAGLHAGEIEVRDATDVAGVAVHMAARVEQAAGAGQILLSGTMRDLLLGSDVVTADAGEHVLKGFEGRWPLYAVC